MSEELIRPVDRDVHAALLDSFYQRNINNQQYKAGVRLLFAIAEMEKFIDSLPDTDEEVPEEVLARGEMLSARIAQARAELTSK